MFYRFRSKLATQDRLEAFIVGVPGTEKGAYTPVPKDYEEKFKTVMEENPFSGVRVFMAPEFDTEKLGVSLMFHPGKENGEIPDIWGIGSHLICSDKFKNVVEQADPFPHQFTPILLLDMEENPLPREQQYYWFNLRRFVKLPPGEAKPASLPFMPTLDEEEFLGCVQTDAAIFEKLSALPLWRYFSSDPKRAREICSLQSFYISPIMLEKFRVAGVTGLEEYSAPYGAGEETLASVHGNREGV